jgi:threonine/homoserine/homoserine lactone efflux protein
LWEIRAFASSYTSVIGPLAAFSVASAIFMAGVSVNRQTPAFQTMIGKLLIAYIVFTGTAMMFASTPGRPSPMAEDKSFERLQRFSIAIAILGYGIGVSIAWLTLRPLLVAIELPALADAFIWVLLVTTIAACARWVLFLYRLFETKRFVANLVPVLGLGFASVYYLFLRAAFPQLWPAQNAPLILTMILFGIVVLGFASHSMMLSSYGSEGFNAKLARHGHRIVLAYYSAATGALFLLWYAVSFAPDAND